MEIRRGMKLSEISKEGFRVNYKQLKKAVNTCELDKKSEDCKKMLKDIGVEWIDE